MADGSRALPGNDREGYKQPVSQHRVPTTGAVNGLRADAGY